VVIAERCTAHDYSTPGKPVIAWEDGAAGAALVDALVGDAHRPLGHLPEQELGPQAAEALALLALVAGQDVEPVEGCDGSDGRWRIAQRVAPDRVISTVDPDARHAHKTISRRQDGFKAHLAIEPDTGIITDCALTRASGTDSHEAQIAVDLLDSEDKPVTVLGDSAYGTGEFRDELGKRGHTDRVKPVPCRESVPGGGLTVDDFTIDHTTGTATCPNGVTRKISRTGIATFKAACTGCPLRTRCTRSRHGKSLKIRPHDALQRAARDPDWQAESPAPTHGRTQHCLALPRQPASALPSRQQERPLAPPPRRRAQPAATDQSGTRSQRHRLDAQLNTPPRSCSQPLTAAHSIPTRRASSSSDRFGLAARPPTETPGASPHPNGPAEPHCSEAVLGSPAQADHVAYSSQMIAPHVRHVHDRARTPSGLMP
jgi:hypothetical protein